MIRPDLLPLRMVESLRRASTKRPSTPSAHQDEDGDDGGYNDDEFNDEIFPCLCFEPVVFHLKGHCDGVQWYKNWDSGKNGKPILAKLIGISSESRGRFPVSGAPTFMVGVYYGTAASYHDVLKVFFEDWDKLNYFRENRETRDFYCQVDFFSVDGVQQKEFKGSARWNSKQSCDWCLSIGLKKVAALNFAHTNATCELRKDEDWESYLPVEGQPVNEVISITKTVDTSSCT